jgi:hypothetical protein
MASAILKDMIKWTSFVSYCMYTHRYLWAHMYISTFVCTYIPSYLSYWHRTSCAYMHICKHTYIHTWTYVHKCIPMYADTYAHTDVWTCVHTHIGMYAVCNKNQVAWSFLILELEATWTTVAIVIQVVLLSVCAFMTFLWLPFITINHAEYKLTEDTNTVAEFEVKTWIKVY